MTTTKGERDMNYYRTGFTFEVLSDAPIPALMDITQVIFECNEGGFVMASEHRQPLKVSGAEMAMALRAAGSEPSFFNLDDKGNPLEAEA